MKETTPAKISYVDGIRFSRAVLVGCQEVISREKELNKINVFPIPDKDTGSNLKKAFHSIESKISLNEASLQKSSRWIAQILKSSALGYSGSVFSGFFSGFAEGIGTSQKIRVQNLSLIADTAIKRARQSFENPIKGTVISVMEAWAGQIKESGRETDDFFVLLKKSYQTAVSALKKTPEQLTVLKKNRVVDAGGQAFVHFLEGIMNFIEKGILSLPAKRIPKDDQRLGFEEQEEKDAFFVECCVWKKDLQRQDLVKELHCIGKELVFFGALNFAKIHIRSTDPQKVLDCVSEYGKITCEHIWRGSEKIPTEKKKPFAIVTDTTCDIPEMYVEKNDLYFVPVKFHAMNKVYTDKKDIIPEEFYDILESSPEIPKTSKPSIQDFTTVYQNLLWHHNSVLSIHLSGSLSGTYQTALQAAKNINPQKITVLDSKNLSVGLGLIILEALRSINKGMGYGDVLNKVEQAIENIDIFIGIPFMKYLIKGGRVTKAKGFLAKIFHINPILSLSPEGALKPVAKTMGKRKLEEAVLSLVFQKIDQEKQQAKGKVLTAVAHVNALESGKRIEQKIKQREGHGPVMVMNASPVLGAHAGPGTIGVAVLRSESLSI
ncbi:MAG: DegV family EDD domain-containing protein [Candidatus Aminicenantes bacterium]|nr:DegV family EDD domain-containing protein [Candidatus Aminicenantes bacterium]